MTKTKGYLLIIVGFAFIVFAGCKKDDAVAVLPSITTTAVSNITINAATSGGTITSDGGSLITASGICWSSINSTPTISDSTINGNTTSGSFTSTINNLKSNTTYYVRAYATNAVGIGYGNVVTFSTIIDTTKVSFSYNGVDVTYGVITSPVTGRKYMDRNLGASELASSVTDTAAYGDLFQWGRLVDGHQLRTSTVVTTVSGTDVPGNGNFILSNSDNFYDWRSPQNDNLWQGSEGVNQPCPSGWHVPTQAEWDAETGLTDIDAIFTQLKLVMSGYRSRLSGNVNTGSLGTQGVYWTSTTETTNAYQFSFSTSFPTGVTSSTQRAAGAAIRCIKD